MWVLDVLGGALAGAFLALTPIPVMPYLIGCMTVAVFREGVWWGLLFCTVNWAFFALTPGLLWFAYEKSAVGCAVMVVVMYFPFWIGLFERKTDA